MDTLCGQITPANHEFAVAIAALPEKIRGFGHVKAASIAKAKDRETSLLEKFRGSSVRAAAAA